jgi:NAD(P)-dependent dehydrogenase (short-subunit alcohol dehydrogenase family)
MAGATIFLSSKASAYITGAIILKEHGDQIKQSVPRNRIGLPEDMAGATIFLSSKASAYITGAIIPVDGGSLIARSHMT